MLRECVSSQDGRDAPSLVEGDQNSTLVRELPATMSFRSPVGNPGGPMRCGMGNDGVEPLESARSDNHAAGRCQQADDQVHGHDPQVEHEAGGACVRPAHYV